MFTRSLKVIRVSLKISGFTSLCRHACFFTYNYTYLLNFTYLIILYLIILLYLIIHALLSRYMHRDRLIECQVYYDIEN